MDFRQPIASLIPGVRGQILTALVESDAELSVRAIARICDVSEAQVSRIMPVLDALGVVERRDVPPSILYRLVRTNVVGELLVDLSNIFDTCLDDMTRLARRIQPPPAALVVFGSFARAEAGPNSDLDVLVVRSDDVNEDEPSWEAGLQKWLCYAGERTGLPVKWIEVSQSEARSELADPNGFWREVPRSLVIAGALPRPRRTRHDVA